MNQPTEWRDRANARECELIDALRAVVVVDSDGTPYAPTQAATDRARALLARWDGHPTGATR